jgi:hypothetical protein
MLSAAGSVIQANQAALGQQIQAAVTREQLDNMKLQGQAVVEMLSESLTQAADRTGRAIGRGEHFDRLA